MALAVAMGAVLLVSCMADPEPYAPREPALTVAVDDSVVLMAPDERPVPVKIFYPEAAGPYPLIVLSHGTFSNRNRYDRIGEFWAGQGYVVMIPQHIDADYGVKPSGYGVMQGVVRTRVADMSLVLDGLDDIEAAVPDLAGKIAPDEYVAAGHSIGTQVAMLVTGAHFRTAFNGEEMAAPESRYRALILVTDPGKMRLMPLDMWIASAVPTFMATGTDDYGLMGSRGEPTEAQTEILSMGVAPDALRYELLLEGGDHYFGGLIQKEVDAEPDHEGLALFNATSTAFLDAVMKDDLRARAYLDTVDMLEVSEGRATLLMP
jgi:dienelactone hydrolase